MSGPYGSAQAAVSGVCQCERTFLTVCGKTQFMHKMPLEPYKKRRWKKFRMLKKTRLLTRPTLARPKRALAQARPQ